MQSPGTHRYVKLDASVHVLGATWAPGPGKGSRDRDTPRRWRASADMCPGPGSFARRGRPLGARQPREGHHYGTTRLSSTRDERGSGRPAAGSRRAPRRRDLSLAVHAQDHRAGGLRLRLDARHRGRGRRLRQAGHHRRQPGGHGALRQGDLLGVGRRPPRGASCGLRRRPPSPLGRGARRQQDLGLRRGAGPGAPEARPHPRLLRQGQRRGPGPAHVLRSPGSDADHRPLQPEGPRRQDGARRVQQRRQFIQTLWLPDKAAYGYDARVQPRLNRMLTSSFTGWNNYMTDLRKVIADAEAMKHFGNTVLVWDFHARKAIQTLEVPGAPLEIRWALQPRHNYAFTTAALKSKIWLIEQQDDGTFKASDVADIANPMDVPLPVDISLSADDRFLFVDTFMDGTCRVYDVSDPHQPKLVHTEKIGSQVNMVSETWDGKRVYFTSSLLANWDKTGKDNEQFLKAYGWDGKQLTALFAVDFLKEKLGRPHIMHFGQERFYKNQIYAGEAGALAAAR